MAICKTLSRLQLGHAFSILEAGLEQGLVMMHLHLRDRERLKLYLRDREHLKCLKLGWLMVHLHLRDLEALAMNRWNQTLLWWLLGLHLMVLNWMDVILSVNLNVSDVLNVLNDLDGLHDL